MMIQIHQHSNVVQCLFVCFLCLTLINGETNQNACWSTSAVYKIGPYDDNIPADWGVNYTEIQLVDECHLTFVQKVANKTCSEYANSPKTELTAFEKYGYGFVAVFIISILSLAGFLAFPLMKKPYYKYLNAFFTALAVGTLFSDSAFELFPVIIEHSFNSMYLQQHGRLPPSQQSDGSMHVPMFLWQMVVVVLTAYVFYVIELAINAFMHHRHGQHAKTSYELTNVFPSSHTNIVATEPPMKPHGDVAIISTNTLPNMTISPEDRQPKSTGWMIIIGDGIHNIADGLAIGAAFAKSPMFGVTTSVAIACHELPTELGEYMVLIESGFTMRRALLFNFISACTAIIGFFIGASAAQDEGARTWIFAITAGTFAYIALVDLWPTLMPHTDRFDKIRFACVTFGYLSGVLLMFILSIFEEKMVQQAE